MGEEKLINREKLLGLFEQNDAKSFLMVKLLVDELIHVEKRLDEIRDLPVIRVVGNDPHQQVRLPSASLYKEYSNKYTEILYRLINLYEKQSKRINNEIDDEPLADFLKSFGHEGAMEAQAEDEPGQ